MFGCLPAGAYGTAGAGKRLHAEAEARALLLAAVTRLHAAHCSAIGARTMARHRKNTSRLRVGKRVCVYIWMFFSQGLFWALPPHRGVARGTRENDSGSRVVGMLIGSIGCEFFKAGSRTFSFKGHTHWESSPDSRGSCQGFRQVPASSRGTARSQRTSTRRHTLIRTRRRTKRGSQGQE